MVLLGVEVLNTYLTKLFEIEPKSSAQTGGEQDEDSQGFTWDADTENEVRFCTDFVHVSPAAGDLDAGC